MCVSPCAALVVTVTRVLPYQPWNRKYANCSTCRQPNVNFRSRTNGNTCFLSSFGHVSTYNQRLPMYCVASQGSRSEYTHTHTPHRHTKHVRPHSYTLQYGNINYVMIDLWMMSASPGCMYMSQTWVLRYVVFRSLMMHESAHKWMGPL